MVRIEGVDKLYGNHQVLFGIDLTIAPGETVCVIGPSGSGKSTLLRCINHLEEINAGSIWVDGELIGYRERGGRLYELREREACRQRVAIGMVFQHFNLFPHMTALENVCFASIKVQKQSRREAEERGRRLLARVGLERQGRCPSVEAVGRAAAARRHRPGDGDGSQADAVRRADERARPRAGGRGARGDEGSRRSPAGSRWSWSPTRSASPARPATGWCSWTPA